MTRTKPRDEQHHGFRYPGLSLALAFPLLAYYRGFWIAFAGTFALLVVIHGLERWCEYRFFRSVHQWVREQGLTEVEPPCGRGLFHSDYGLWTFSDTRLFRARRPNGTVREIRASYYAPYFGLYLDVLCGWS